ncbi:MAG: S9 family peptidase [bacterium]
MRFFIFLLSFIIFTGVVIADDNSNTHPFTVHDMLAMHRISDPQLSPDGKLIVFTLRKTDMKANKGRTDLWIVGTDGKGLQQLTTHNENDWSPRWSKCSKRIWFLSSRSGSVQVWSININGGEAVQVTDLPLNVANLKVSPASGYIAFTMQVFPDKGCPENTKKKLDETKNQKVSGRIYETTFIRHWDTWEDGRRSHLFVMNCKDRKSINLMKGMDADTPSKPFGGPEEITFTPDGKGLIFTAKDVGDKAPWSTNFDLFYVPIDGSQEPECITSDNEAWDTQPVFSPDGKTLAYLAMSRPGYESDRYRIMLRSWPDGKTRVLTENWDRSPSSICWSPDSKKIFSTAANLGQRSLFAIDVESGEVEIIVRNGNIGSIAIGKDRIIFGRDDLKSPVELFSVKLSGDDMRSITDINKDNVSQARMGNYEQFTFKGWNDEKVYCYVVKPVDFDPSNKYPVAFLIHGGPQGSFGNHFHYRWNPQAYTGAGYAAVMVDFHGSVGYGQDFCDAIRGDWGGKPLIDLQKGLKAALDKFSWMDKDRVGALGASFGGFMINWIAGNWPDRFKCLVNHDGNLDERFAYYATEELWFPEWDHNGTPWENPEGYEKYNPVNYVENWKTPMLIIHGAEDFRVVETQGMAAFNALQRLGIPSKFLYFPDENHWVLQPHNSVQWHETVIAWLDTWLKK